MHINITRVNVWTKNLETYSGLRKKKSENKEIEPENKESR